MKSNLKGKSIEERIWNRVQWKPSPENLLRPVLGDCAIWTGSLSPKGYPSQIYDPEIRSLVRVGRWVFEKYIAKLPLDHVPDHLCRVRACINPLHVEAVTTKENGDRGLGVGALNARKLYCPHGHQLVPVSWSGGYRKRCCPICNGLTERRRRHQIKGVQSQS
jgi:hypothetical protein